MRSFSTILAVAALVASPLVSARTIQVQSEDLEMMRDEITRMLGNSGSSGSSGSSATYDRSASSVVVPTVEDGSSSTASSTTQMQGFPSREDIIAQGGDPNAPSVVVPTLEDSLTNVGGPEDEYPGSGYDTLGQSPAPGSTYTGQGTCTNADKQCNAFTHYTHCWQVCLASQKTKNPIGRGSDGKAPDCAKWCESSCGCDKSLDPSATTGSAYPSDAAYLSSMYQRSPMNQRSSMDNTQRGSGETRSQRNTPDIVI